MLAKDAREEFMRWLAGRRSVLEHLDPRAGIEAMLGFFHEVRLLESESGPDADMLLLQWGTFDWGEGRHFELDVTRQLDLGLDDEGLWQLQLTFRFPPEPSTLAFGSHDRWYRRGETEGLRTMLDEHPLLRAIGLRRDGQVELAYECAG